MINLPLLLAFITAASILTITPGVDTAMVLRTVATGGRRPAMMAAIGIALGCLIWGGAVSFGLGALLQASEVAYALIKFIGAAYLLLVGSKLLMSPRTSVQSSEQASTNSGKQAFWRGFLTNLLNPKVGIFYVTFLPQFIPANMPVSTYSLFLACIHICLSLVWFALLIAATAPLGKFLQQPTAVKTLDRLTGAVFIIFGVKLATSTAR